MAEIDVNDPGNQLAAGAVGGSVVTIIGSTAIGGTAVGGTIGTGLTSLATASAAPAAVKAGFLGVLKIVSLVNPITASLVIGGIGVACIISKIK